MARKLFLLFNLGDERFAVSTELITEIIPLVELTSVPKTEPYICGLFNYRGETIPVIDTVMLLYNRPHDRKICTRIIVLTSIKDDCITRVGLIAEKVNKTEAYDTEQISEHALTVQHTPCLGKIINDGNGEIQLIDLEKLIPQEANCLRVAAGHS
jgi:chemotaxis-related protein WspB